MKNKKSRDDKWRRTANVVAVNIVDPVRFSEIRKVFSCRGNERTAMARMLRVVMDEWLKMNR